MAIHRVKVCACGHAIDWHQGKGKCTYGHNHAMGGCDCPKFHRRGSPAATPTVIMDTAVMPTRASGSLANAVAHAIRALQGLHAELTRDPSIHPLNGAPKATVEAFLKKIPPPVMPTPKAPKADTGEIKLRAGERKMLEALAGHHPTPLTRAQLGTLVGIAARGSTFGTYLGILKRHDLVMTVGNQIELTLLGLNLVPADKRKRIPKDDVLRLWMTRLRAGERAMLAAVVETRGIYRSELGKVVDIDPLGSTFGTYLGILKRNDLVIVDGHGGGFIRPGGALA